MSELTNKKGFPGGTTAKNPSADAGDAGRQIQSLGQEGLLEEDMTARSNILAWGIPWTEEVGGLQSKGLKRVRCD